MSLLKEDNGNYSMTRVLSLIVVGCGVAVGLVALLTKTLDSDAVALSLGLVGLGFTGKTVSKKLEV